MCKPRWILDIGKINDKKIECGSWKIWCSKFIIKIHPKKLILYKIIAII